MDAIAIGLFWTVVVTVIIVGSYFVPTLVALKKHKRNVNAIAAVNILLGWTFLGWVVALVWTLTEDQPVYQGR